MSRSLSVSAPGAAAVPAPAPPWEEARRHLIEAGGNATQSFGLGRTLGQVYAIVYLSAHPICLDEIAAALGVSKAGVSTTIRQLAAWSAVRRVWVKGDRRDFYEAETDFRAVLRNGLLETIRKKLSTAGFQISELEHSLAAARAEANGANGQEMQVIADRLDRARQFQQKIDALLSNPLIERLL